MTLGDIYYVLFRHKWKIIACTLVGILFAAGLYFSYPPRYQSDAMLFIRYVINESKAPGPASDTGAIIKSPDQDGETIMNSEVAILNSLDLAHQAAETVGADKILAKMGGGRDLDRAAQVVKNGLTVEVLPKSSVIKLDFKHRDPEVTQPVLRAIIDRYLKMHVDIHRPVGIVGDFLNQETEELRSGLSQTEDELRSAYAKAGFTSVPEAKKTNAEAMARIQQEIFDTQADLAERTSAAPQISGTATAATAKAVPPDQLQKYQDLRSRLDGLRTTEQQLLTQFTDQNYRVKQTRTEIADTQSHIRQLEVTYPQISDTATPAPAIVTSNEDQDLETLSPAALQARIVELNKEMAELRAENAGIGQAEGSIEELERRKSLQESNYRYYAASLEQSRINEALGSGRVSNISEIQEPSPPTRELQQFAKTLGGVTFLGLAVGLLWAFSIEYFFDPSVKRPIEVERTLGLPLFISIPRIGRRELRALPPSPEVPNGSSMVLSPADELHVKNAAALQPYHDTLRDRLIAYFENINLTHKPKLVAVTGLGHSTGVSTIAAGLARSLSETGDGNVLLVDMSKGQESSQEFFKGRPVCGIDDVLSIPQNAQVQDNLYVVAEEPDSSSRLSRVMPQRFSKLVPKLKAANFDYIIFDMPSVSQLSITPRLAGFMDMVMLVIESEKADREVVKNAVSILERAKTHIGVVLNKTKNYVPAGWYQESLSNT
ncbi:MAG TPA: Wzz/FepE/Etk N-terminal domain-containing protein [Opitutaceae bacterium]|jgi:uncharacterized protein involved in exopolysaccharide biosynthesis/Mrp family chromosome partitioning ATPase